MTITRCAGLVATVCLTVLSGALSAAVQSPNLVVDATGGVGTFRTVQAAINAAPAGTAEKRTRILIKPGTYTEQIRVPESKRFLTLVGQGAKPDDVVLTFNLHAKSPKPGGGTVGT